MVVIGLLLAVLVGLSVSLLGGGGAILAVPIFVYVLGFDAKEAVASSLAVVGLTSLSGAVSHWREGRTRLRIALVFGIFAMAGAYLGAWLAVFFSSAAQLALLAVMMVVAAFFMFRDNNKSDEDEEGTEPESPSIAQVPLGRAVGLAVLAVAVGGITGLVGVGGFLTVPALVLVGQVPTKEALGTSLLVIVMISAAGFVGYLGKVEIQWGPMALFTALAVAGSFAGAYLVRFVPQGTLRKLFAVFLVLLAIFILYQYLGEFF
jgi:uncharacterized membrane protein YfcA